MKTTNNPPEILTPELDKMRSVRDRSQVCGEFLEWLRNERGISLAEYRGSDTEDGDVLCAVNVSIEQILADFFGIDLGRVEEERRLILEMLLARQKGAQQ